MSEQQPEHDANSQQDEPQVVIVGPDGIAVAGSPGGSDDHDSEPSITDMVEQPAKVMRIGSMIKQLLEEVRAAPLDEKSRARLKEIHKSSKIGRASCRERVEVTEVDVAVRTKRRE